MLSPYFSLHTFVVDWNIKYNRTEKSCVIDGNILDFSDEHNPVDQYLSINLEILEKLVPVTIFAANIWIIACVTTKI